MSEHENKLIHYAVHPNCSTNKLELGVIGVVEDEMVLIEVGQPRTSNATGHLNKPILEISNHHSGPLEARERQREKVAGKK